MIYREGLGRPLTWQELDDNFKEVGQQTNQAAASATASANSATSAAASASTATQSTRAVMGNVGGSMTATPGWDNVPLYQDPSIGGQGGALNRQGQALYNRQERFKQDLAAAGGAGLVGPGVITRDGDKFSILQGRAGEQFGDDVTKGFGLLLAEPITGTPPNASTAKINYIRIEDDQLNAVDDSAPGTKVDGLLVSHSFGGAAAKGGRHAGEFVLTHAAPTAGTNTDRNYVGVTAWCNSEQGDGGTSDADVRGAYFGGNFLATLSAGAMYTTNLTGAEFNVSIAAGASTRIRTGLQVGGSGTEQGTVIDAALCVGNKAGAVAWRNGIRISNQNGGESLGTGSKVLVATAPTTVAAGFEIPKCSQAVLLSGDVELTNSKLSLTASGSSVELGSKASASTVFIDANTSGNNIDYDSRLVFSGGSASVGGGTAALQAGTIQLSSTTEIVMGSTIRPGADNVYDYGTASRRGRTAFFGTGAINTSDESEKTQPEVITDEVLDAVSEVDWCMFQFLDMVEAKGHDKARWHFGGMAQQFVRAFERHGLDPFRFAFICYDEWEDQYVKVQTNEGETVTKTRTVSQPVMVASTREAMVDEVLDDGTKIKKAITEEYLTPKLDQVYIFNKDGSPRLDDNGVRCFVFEPVMEDIIEEYTEPAPPEYVDVLEVPAGSRYGVRYDQAIILKQKQIERDYKRQIDRLVLKVEALEQSCK